MSGTVPGSDQPSSGAPPRALFMSSAVFLCIFFATFLLVMALAFCCCRRRDPTGPDHAERGGSALPGQCGDPFPVESLPTFAYGRHSDGRGGAADGGRECAVCLGAVQEGEMVRRLPACMHVYHVECIDRWLAAHRTCPLCRSELDPCKVASETQPAAQEDRRDQLPV